MVSVERFVGFALRGDFLSYSVLFKNSLHNIGSLELRQDADYFSKLNSVASLIRQELGKDGSSEAPWKVGILDNVRKGMDPERFAKMCRLRTIVECSSILNFNTSPIVLTDSHICKSIGRIGKCKIVNVNDVIKFGSERLSNFLNFPTSLQFHSIVLSWATALSLQNSVELEDVVLSKSDQERLRGRLLGDKIINELVQSINKSKRAPGSPDKANAGQDSGSAHAPDANKLGESDLERVLRRRIGRLVEEYLHQHH